MEPTAGNNNHTSYPDDIPTAVYGRRRPVGKHTADESGPHELVEQDDELDVHDHECASLRQQLAELDDELLHALLGRRQAEDRLAAANRRVEEERWNAKHHERRAASAERELDDLLEQIQALKDEVDRLRTEVTKLASAQRN